MSYSQSATLCRLRLRNAQSLVCERDRWLSLKARINQLRTRELKKVVANGGIQTQRDLLLSAAMNRMYEVREVRPLFFAVGKKELAALARTSCAADDAQSAAQSAAELSPALLEDGSSPQDLPRLMFPPGKDNPRQTPRRPGAPSTAPALINQILINAGRDSSC